MMKLFTRYNRINLLSTVIIFLLVSIAYGFLLRYVLIDQVDENLKIEQQEIQNYIVRYNRLPETIPVRDQHTVYSPATGPAGRVFMTTGTWAASVKEKTYYRLIVFNVKAGGNWWKVSVGKSLEGTDDMIRSIIVITLSTILLILLASVITNRILLARLWKPFYHTLDLMRNFSLGRQQRMPFAETDIEEFRFMNETLRQSLSKAEQDYLLLKEFTANAAHELQTPLSVIRSKMDLLIQDEHLSEPQSEAVQMAYDAIQKLSRLNQGLLLLAKIENRQFEEAAPVNLKERIEKKMAEFQEIWQAKQLCVTSRLQDGSVVMNSMLAEVMLNNLFSNATRHNIPGGGIHVSLQSERLLISNTGTDGGLDPQQLFTRFYKASAANEHNGLGLSIVKQICEASGFRVRYAFKDDRHVFEVLFSGA